MGCASLPGVIEQLKLNLRGDSTGVAEFWKWPTLDHDTMLPGDELVELVICHPSM